MTENSKRRFRIFQDEIKLRHTSHWDMDTMSRAELEACMQATPEVRTSAETMAPGLATPAAAGPGTAESAWSKFLRACLPGR